MRPGLRADNITTFMCLNLMGTSGPVQASTAIALPLPLPNNISCSVPIIIKRLIMPFFLSGFH